MKTFNFALMLLLAVGCVEHDFAPPPGPCNEDSDPVEFTVTPFTNGFQGCPLKNIDAQNHNVTLVIRTQSDFNQYIDCDVVVDFTKYTVLAGRMITPTLDGVLAQAVSKMCNVYTYHVEIGGGNATAIGHVYHFAVIPKIANDATVNFDVVYID